MYFQETKGYYLYQYSSVRNKVTLVGYYSSLESFFYCNLSLFSNSDVDKDYILTDHPQEISAINSKCCLLTETGETIPYSQLIYEYRQWNKARLYNFWHKINLRRRKQVSLRRYRPVKTTSERRANESFDRKITNFSLRIKGRKRYLPDSYCDIMGHNDKSWKTQSKKKHQYD